VKISYHVFNDLSDFRKTQMAIAPATVEIRLQFRTATLVIFNFPKMLPLGAKRFRKRIDKAYCDKLCQAWFIPVREVSALMPAAKAALEVFSLRG